jgi:hypothetical protein
MPPVTPDDTRHLINTLSLYHMDIVSFFIPYVPQMMIQAKRRVTCTSCEMRHTNDNEKVNEGGTFPTITLFARSMNDLLQVQKNAVLKAAQAALAWESAFWKRMPFLLAQ